MAKNRKKIAALMILLVIMLPVYSASVFASLSVEARGQDNVKNYVKEEDFIVFKATASINGDDTISSNQIFLGSDLEFNSCAAGIDGFDCALKFPSNGTTAFDAKAIPYTITLKNDMGSVVETKTDNVFVDNLPPEITSFEVDEALVSSGTVKFSFNIEDKACSASGCSGKCSGISKIELSESDTNFKETITLNTNACIVSDSFETSSLIFSEGPHTIFAKAFDRFGEVSPTASAVFEFDKSAPFIDLNTFKVVDDLDVDFGFFGVNAVPVTVKVEIKDSDLDKGTVFADLSELNKNVNLKNVPGTCGNTEEDITTCSWNINLAPDGAGQKTVTIEASDTAGNKAKSIVTKNFELDNKGPVVLSLASSQVIEGQNFAKLSDNAITATFKENVGVKASDIQLHFNNAVKTSDSCSQVLDIWQCTWNNVNFNNQGKVNVFIGTDSKDRLGNFISSRFSREFIVDGSKPKLLKLVIRSIGGTEGTLEGVIKTGDKVQIEAVLEDDAIEKATADFSRFIFNARDVNADTCVKTGDKRFVCSWTTSSIDIDGYIDNFIGFEFTDVSGNTLSVNEPFTVYGVSGEQTTDLFEHSVSCSPSLLDRETMSLINQRAFCQISLTPKSIQGSQFENVEPISISLGQCSGNTGFANNFDIFNNDMGSAKPVIRVEFSKQVAGVDEITFVCPVDIIARKGTNIITTPEKENIELKFQLYNMPLGEISQGVQKKIDDAIDDAEGIWDFVGILNDISFYSKRVCQGVNTAALVVGIFQNYEQILATARAIFVGQPTDLALAPEHLASAISTESMRQSTLAGWGIFNEFCAVVNCKYTVADEKGENPKVVFGGVGEVLNSWQQGGEDIIRDALGGKFVDDYFGDPEKKKRDIRSYMNPKESVIVAGMTACIPGLIYGLEKYRQIECMYADCLQTGVGQQGLPVFACEDQKSYAECKYVTGEIFKVISPIALFDYYMNLIKGTLANPLRMLGAGIGAVCNPGLVVTKPVSYGLCAGAKIFSLIGTTVQEVTSIIDSDTWTIREDYCDKLDEDESESEDSGGFFE